MSTPEGSDPISCAQECWTEKFNAMPFTTFHMLDYLLRKAEITYEQYVEKPELLQQHKAPITDDDAQELKELASQPGRCTNFACQVVNALNEMHEGVYDFRFFDIDEHRVAVCKKTGVLIDSSLPGVHKRESSDDWARNKTRRVKCRSEGAASALQSFAGVVKDYQWKTVTAPMKTSFQGNMSDSRQSSDDGVELLGVIEWDLERRTLSLATDLESCINQTYLVEFFFTKAGPADLERFCEEYVAKFLGSENVTGSFGELQWSRCQTLHRKVWHAAKAVWGSPIPIFPEEQLTDIDEKFLEVHGVIEEHKVAAADYAEKVDEVLAEAKELLKNVKEIRRREEHLDTSVQALKRAAEEGEKDQEMRNREQAVMAVEQELQEVAAIKKELLLRSSKLGAMGENKEQPPKDPRDVEKIFSPIEEHLVHAQMLLKKRLAVSAELADEARKGGV
ncbi:hypothetical protein CLAIMM_01319 [Cladophialophora immunda]|nr:hypothetical protein CLAIMM_01319 [Cladophialophora immunda]